MSGELVSVIIPVHNRAGALARSVGSICAQSYRALEILVIDDASDDDVKGAIAALNDPRIRLIRRKRNGGAAAARNVGLDAATGDYIAFMDSDDISLFDRIARQVALIQTLPDEYVGVYAAAIAHTDTDEGGRGQAAARVLPPPNRAPLSGDLSAATLTGNFIDMPTMLLRARAARAAGPFDERLRNNVDWDYTLRLTRAGKFGFIPQPLYVFSYAARGDAGNDHISHRPGYSAQSYARITGKLRHAGLEGRDLARHYAAAGSYLMRQGRAGRARAYFDAARRMTPTDPRPYLHLLLSHVPGLHAWARGRSARVRQRRIAP